MTIILAFLLNMAFLIPSQAEVKPGLEPKDTFSQCVTGESEDGVYTFKAKCKEWIIRSGHRVYMEYNSLGLRDIDHTPWPQKGWKRVLVVGGSALVGPGIEESKSPVQEYSKIIKRLGKKIEVINAGVEGYAIVHSAVKLKTLLEAYHPTHVLLFTSFINSVNFDSMYGDEIITNADQSLKLEPKFGYFINEILGFRNKLQKNWKENIGTANSLKYFSRRAFKFAYCKARHRSALKQLECASSNTLSLLSYMMNISRQYGADFSLIFPDMVYSENKILLNFTFNEQLAMQIDRLTPSPPFSSDEISKLLRIHNIPHNILWDFSGRAYFLGNSPHLTELGAKKFGEKFWENSKTFLGE